MAIAAMVLAAGASRRLGQPKQLVRLDGETLLERTVRVAREAGARPVLVVLGANLDVISAATDLSAAQVVFNANWEQGIASSIHAGVTALEEMAPSVSAVLLLVCDQPRLSAEHLAALMEMQESMDEPAIVASRYAGLAGIPAMFPMSEFGALLELKGDMGARYLLREPKCAMATIEFDGGEVDMDTPEDLQRL